MESERHLLCGFLAEHGAGGHEFTVDLNPQNPTEIFTFFDLRRNYWRLFDAFHAWRRAFLFEVVAVPLFEVRVSSGAQEEV